ncbi:MAG: aldo/keto reductase [Lachnospiraceae bacterium]|nr:aldo/keto reductase [Lachnospiraceae bacterium]
MISYKGFEMQYRLDKYGNELSVLGYGCMRFTNTAGHIDMQKAETEIMRAYELGVNYYDTAYIYTGSEVAVGEIFERNNIRDKINIATKLPHYMVKNPADMDRLFEEQLKRLRTDHVDYYLMHMLTDIASWNRIRDMGIIDWIEKRKASGQIRQIGFSYHGNSDMFMKILDDYDWEFAQIQYNYIDEHSQAGRTGLERAEEKKIPIIIMEPLRGGKLVNGLPKEAGELIKNHPSGRSAAEWALGWLYDQSGVKVVLSGMNSVEMIEENCRIASEYTPGSFTVEDHEAISEIVKLYHAHMRVGCTGCRYCMPCPHNVDIPGTFAAYNRQAVDGKLGGLKEYFMCTAMRKDYTGPANCIECGLCEKHCPQGIKIREELKNARKSLETPIYKIGRKFVPFFAKF